tara:strand:- start:299 stop:1297 length:999 start_codon:yes stop_codon:yes gene_type:complete
LDKKTKNTIFFIEGQEHVRFVEPYISIVYNIGYEIKIISLENLNFRNHIFNDLVEIINPKKIRPFLKKTLGDLFFTTTPGVGSYYFPKIKKTKYIYIFHSLVSPNEVYLDKSFVNFDYILSPNEIISSQLKFLITSKTKTFTVGYPVLEYYMNKPKSNKDKILLAPSWGKDSFLFNDDIIQELYRFLSMKNADIILRPHPMHLKKVYENNLFQNSKFVIDKNKNLDYLKDVILLITDWSGISLEYYFLNKSPTIFIDNNKKTRRKLTKKELNLVLIENKIRDKIGNIVNPHDLSSLQNLNLKENIHLDDDYIDSIYKPEFINEKVSEIILTF